MDPGIRSHGMKADPPGYLQSKYECFLMSGWWDILHSSCFNVKLCEVIPRTGQNYKWKDENYTPLCINAGSIKMTVPSEYSDQPGHPPSLIRVFTMHSMSSWGPNISSCGWRRLWSVWANVQADPSLRWAHMPFWWFCHEVAQMMIQEILPVFFLEIPDHKL